MEHSCLSAGGSGLWNSPRPPPYCQKAEDMKKLRKEEAILTYNQRKESIRSTKFVSTSDSQRSSVSESVLQCKPRSLRRIAEDCRAKGSYEREKFHPGPKRDLEKEKRRLQHIMARGKNKEPSAGSAVKKPEACKSEQLDLMDHYEEVLNEIEERRKFLADMAALGQEQQYLHIINAEISQKFRELDIINQGGKSKQKTDS